MLTIYTQSQTDIHAVAINADNKEQLKHALWIDLLSPTELEENIIEQYLKLEIPTKNEMDEIEPSSRLYAEDDVLFMTTNMVAQSDDPEPKSDAVTFILTKNMLITVRYIEPLSFNLFINQLKRAKIKNTNALHLLVGILETTTDRLADILEKVSLKFDQISHTVFRSNEHNTGNEVNYKNLLQAIGSNGILGTKIRDSLVSFIRLISFLEQKHAATFDHEIKSRIAVMNKDIHALSDYAIFISSEVNFLLDATLGMINIEQNNIIKIFSVAAVIFLPPTLIASIYGMNFKHIPELSWLAGYPFSLSMMVISAWLPYQYFRKKKWL
ncbi:MAG: magnesium transporter CorA family protein [Legionella sp.]